MQGLCSLDLIGLARPGDGRWERLVLRKGPFGPGSWCLVPCPEDFSLYVDSACVKSPSVDEQYRKLRMGSSKLLLFSLVIRLFLYSLEYKKHSFDVQAWAGRWEVFLVFCECLDLCHTVVYVRERSCMSLSCLHLQPWLPALSSTPTRHQC